MRPDLGSLRRIEALVDGVFAMMMTVIVLQIAVPRGPEAALWHDLRALVPTLLTYALTFITLGALWFGNRTQSEFILRANHTLVWLSLGMVGLVALVPFSAALLAANHSSRTAVVIYGAHLTMVFAAHGLIWLYASLRPELLREGVTAAYRRKARLPSFLPAIGYAVATALGALDPIAGLVGYVLMPVPLVAGTFYRWLAVVHARANAMPG
jgi:uncharacterized membrane protein